MSRRGMTLRDIARLMSEGPAKLARIDARKGKLEAGFDADFIVFDDAAPFRVEPAIVGREIVSYAANLDEAVVLAFGEDVWLQ